VFVYVKIHIKHDHTTR